MVTLDSSGGQRRINVAGDDITIKNMTIVGQGSADGIFTYKRNGLTISNVHISNVFHGIVLRGSSGSVITDSSISAAGGKGVEISVDLGSSIVGGSGNTLMNTTVTGTGSPGSLGVYLEYGTHNNTIVGNTISNFEIGLRQYYNSDWNTVYQNNFIDNTGSPILAYTSNSVFNLSAPNGGNYYSNFDEAAEGCWDSNQDGFCDDPYVSLFGATDYLPFTTQDGGLNTPDATGTVTVADGGTVSTGDGSVVIDVEADSVAGDTTIEVYLEEITNPDIIVGDNSYFDTAMAIYEFGPDGTEFNPAALLTLTIDVTALTPTQRGLISIYRHEDTDFDGDIDGDDGFREIPGTICTVSEDPINTFVSTCTAPIEHFSTYAIILLNDSDEDGIPDSADVCPAISSAGFDADNDGCIDSFAGLSELISSLVDQDAISTKMENSLLSKVFNAEKSAGKNELCVAVDKLYDLGEQISSQSGKKVSPDAAITVLSYSGSLIDYLQSFLEAGDSC